MARGPMRILQLQAENVKRLTVVDITPASALVEIAGKNGQGKTSVLDCILWAMEGERPIQWKPIRDGQAKAKITLKLGDDDGLRFEVVRTFNAQDDGTFTTNLKVVNEDGFKAKGEATFVKGLIEGLSFDPAAFLRAGDGEQVKMLRGMVPGVDFAAIDRRRRFAFDERTQLNKDEATRRAAAESITVPDDTPDEPIDTDPMMTMLADLGNATRAYDVELNRRRGILQSIESLHDTTDIDDEIEKLVAKVTDLRRERESNLTRAEKYDVERKAWPGVDHPGDGEMMRKAIEDANAINALVRRKKAKADGIAGADEIKGQIAQLTQAIEDADAEVRKAIEAAKLPVTGLELTPDRVVLRGVPFAQASDAEQLRASMALGMALNPKLRVMRIRNGNDFDSDAMAVIREVAEDEGFQVWIERVVADGPDAIIMEAGHVKDAAPKA